MAFSISLASTRVFHRSGASSEVTLTASPRERRSSSVIADGRVVEIEHRRLQGPASAERQEAAGQPRPHARGFVGAADEIALLRTIEPHVEQLQIAGDDRQQVVEIVRETAGQLPDGLHLLGLGQLPLGFPSASSAACRSVRSVMMPVKYRLPLASNSLTERWIGNVEPSLRRAVTSRPMPMIFRLPRVEIGLQIAVMLAGEGLGHENANILPDQLLVRVTEQPCSGRIDRLDFAAQVDGQDRIDGSIVHRLELAGALGHLGFQAHVAADQRVLGLIAPGEITIDLQHCALIGTDHPQAALDMDGVAGLVLAREVAGPRALRIQGGDEFLELPRELRLQQHMAGFADRLSRGKPVKALAALVPERDPSIEIPSQHRLEGEFDEVRIGRLPDHFELRTVCWHATHHPFGHVGRQEPAANATHG